MQENSTVEKQDGLLICEEERKIKKETVWGLTNILEGTHKKDTVADQN
jgi:hypothetical protein